MKLEGLQVYEVLAQMVRSGEPGALVTIIRADRSSPRHQGSKMVVRADGTAVGSVGGGRVEALATAAALETIGGGGCRTMDFDLKGKDGVCGGDITVFIEPLQTAIPFLLLGGGHVGKAMAETGSRLPLLFTVFDDRPEWADPPAGMRAVAAPMSEWADRLEPTPETMVLVCTRSHELDAVALEALFAAEARRGVRCGWVGVIGSSGKARNLAKRFAADPDLSARFAEVIVPTGLAIGAETPHEIALSVLAEALAYIRGAAWLDDGDGKPRGVLFQRCRPKRKRGVPDGKAET